MIESKKKMVRPWCVGMIGLLVFWSVTSPARHGSGVLEPRRATPGINVELVKMPSSASPGGARYRLRADGVPPGIIFEVWTKDFGQPFALAFSGFRMGESGTLVSLDKSGQSRRLEDLALDPGPYPKGAVWMVALASEDHTLSAFAKVIPYPIAARDGSCTVSVELISLHGNRFVASGEGFVPGEDVDIEFRASGRVTQRRQRISSEGLLPLDVLSHGAISTDFGASYLVKARSCEPVVKYEWGDAALIRR